MIVTAHQPVYMPWLGLFHKIALADVFCFFECVQYQPKDWNNRNKIKFCNGTADWLTVPVLRKGFRERLYPELRINNENPWRHKHWMSLELNYCKAPYFPRYRDELKALYDREWERLVDLNYEMLGMFLRWLGISTKIVRMRDYSFRGRRASWCWICAVSSAQICIYSALRGGITRISHPSSATRLHRISRIINIPYTPSNTGRLFPTCRLSIFCSTAERKA